MKPTNEIYLTEMSLLELSEGKKIYDNDGEMIIHPPTTNELGIMRRKPSILPLVQARLYTLEDAESVRASLYGEEIFDAFPLSDFEDDTGQVRDYLRRESVVNCLLKHANASETIINGDAINIPEFQKCFKKEINKEDINSDVDSELFDDWEDYQVHNFVAKIAIDIMAMR